MKPSTLSAWKNLEKQADRMQRPENHLKNLISDENRLSRFSAVGAGLFFDFSRQRLDRRTLDRLCDLARQRRLPERFNAMIRGEKVNTTENRAALHTAARCFKGTPVLIDGADVMPDIRRVRNQLQTFSARILSGDITGSTGKAFTHIVVIGIGGSCLGAEFVSRALQRSALQGMHLHFLSNVDIHNFASVKAAIDPETTLWVVISKSHTTVETMANAAQARRFMEAQHLSPSEHFVTVTGKGSPGDDPANPSFEIFHMFDFIGGRFSVSSAVGGVPLSLYLGWETFEKFLKGAEEMDVHAARTPVEKNLPMLSALISVWNNNFLGYPVQAIVPYSAALSRLPAHIQQLSMESNGKSVAGDGKSLTTASGTVIFGEPGTNAQHSFFQLAHQGRGFPIEFIGVLDPQDASDQITSAGVTNHQELWANLIAQPTALAEGRKSSDPARCFPGNRPSSTLVLGDAGPENIGRLLSFYEARTVMEAFIWGINPFDQFGVELGKSMASGIRQQLALHNKDAGHDMRGLDATARFYLDMLQSAGKSLKAEG